MSLIDDSERENENKKVANFDPQKKTYYFSVMKRRRFRFHKVLHCSVYQNNLEWRQVHAGFAKFWIHLQLE